MIEKTLKVGCAMAVEASHTPKYENAKNRRIKIAA